MVFPVLVQASDTEKTTPATSELTDAPRPKAFIPRQSYWNRYIGDLYLCGGFSREFNYNSQTGGKLVLDYMVDDQVSIGAQTGSYWLRNDDGRFVSSYLGARLSYHLLKAKLHKRKAHWNVYTGISGDVEIGGAEKDWHEKRFFIDLHLGARYRLSDKFFLWGEADITNATIGLSFTL